MKIMKDVPSGTKKKIEFLLWKKIIDEKDEGRAIGYKKENWDFTGKKKMKMKMMKDVAFGNWNISGKKSQDESDEGRAIGSKKENGF